MLDRVRRIIEPILIATIICTLLAEIGVPVAWLLGSLIVGIIYVVLAGKPHPLPQTFLIIGKSLVGITAAARFSPEHLVIIATFILPLLLAFALTISLSMFNGYLIARVSGIPLITSLMGAIPGTASANVAISQEFGADPPVVAVLQYLRLVMVVIIVPAIASLMTPEEIVLYQNTNVLIAQSVPLIWNLIMLGICCGLGIWVGRTFKLPTKEFLGSFICGLPLFGLFPHQYNVPRSLITIALLLIGLSAGLKFNLQNIVGLGRAVVLEIILVLILIACCIGVAYIFHYFVNIDLTTALLAFAPGGMEAMIATSNQLGGNTGLVLTIKFIHQLIIIFTVNTVKSYLHSNQHIDNN